MRKTDKIIEISSVDTRRQILYPPCDERRLEGKEQLADHGQSELLTAQEVCEHLRISKSYLYWLTHKDKIPRIKMQGHLRFRRSDIDDWLRSQEVRSGST